MSLANRLAVAILAAALALPAAAQDGPSRQALSAAEYHVGQMEKAIERARGKEIDPKRFGSQAMKRVRDLKEQYPDHPKVEELFQRVRAAVKASRGDVFEITEDMLAYRSAGDDVASTIGERADAGWTELIASFKDDPRFLADAFPVPDPDEPGTAEDMVGRTVLFEDFRYPAHEFTNTGVQFVYVGDRARGMYFVELGRPWTAAYEALKRYRTEVGEELPEVWTVVGRITGSDLLVPMSGEENTATAVHAWTVEPLVLYLPGKALAYPLPSHPKGGTFEGEAEVAALKRPHQTVRVIPEGIEPAQLVALFATAIKERNRDLYLEAIDPALKSTAAAMERLEKFWDINQRRFAELYVHIDPFETGEITAIRGERLDDATDENFFLDDEDKKEIAARADDLVEQVAVKIRAFDEKGKQEGPPKDVILRRYDGERWFVYEGFPL